MQVSYQSMSSKCINNSKLNSNAFEWSMRIFMNANKNAHDAMLNMIIIFGSLPIKTQNLLHSLGHIGPGLWLTIDTMLCFTAIWSAC